MPESFDIPDFDELYDTDPTKERDGAWVDIPGLSGKRIKIRSSDSPKVRDAAAKIQRRHMPTYKIGKVPPAEDQDKDKVSLLATAIVVAWEGFGDVPCNDPTIRAVMTRYPKIRDLVIQLSDQAENFRRVMQDELAGNSVPPSAAS